MSGRVQSVDRAMTIMEALGREGGGKRLTDLARVTQLSLTTVHRLLTTLEQRHFVQFSTKDNLWHIGRGAFAVGNAFTRDRNFVAAALPFLKTLRDKTHETANLGIVEDHEIVLVNQIQSREINRSISTIGGRTPLFASGMGKAVLSSYPEDEVRTLIRRSGMRRVTAKTITTPTDLEYQLGCIKLDGFSIDDEEYRVGVRCVAAAVYDGRDEVVCAISVSGTPARIPNDRVGTIGRMVLEAAQGLSRAMGANTYPTGP
ncbi:IclR family transcriptional regulator [Devosia yakushimensis]|uniref:IclR family transcriptional regulator n=1 Tax=Devosia yakushimensis TaxID=470028 RepID=UPI0024E08255|nr:IclR family transcriptional regulator [Devosia yakushimensis]